jgi:hypothetical protein
MVRDRREVVAYLGPNNDDGLEGRRGGGFHHRFDEVVDLGWFAFI